MAETELILRGGTVLDVGTGELTRADLGIRDGVVADPQPLSGAPEVDVSGLTVLFGLWDCHAHPGSLMYDPVGNGYFENLATRAIRAGENLREAVSMGVTGVRTLGDAGDLDIAWTRAFAAGRPPGPRILPAGPAIRTTGGHGTAFPRRYTEFEQEIITDGPDGMARAVRRLNEHGSRWVKLLLTGGLYSEHETVDGLQFTAAELEAVMGVANDRGLPVAAHCGGPRVAERFARLGGRSVEHGYALDPEAAVVLAEHGTWLVPTISVTHDTDMMERDGWPPHAARRAVASAAAHAAALHACIEAGVKIATGADLNPIGPRLHRELEMLEKAGLTRLQVLHAATAGSRELNGLGAATRPGPGAAADLIFVEGSPLDDLTCLRRPAAVMTYGRFVHPPRGTTPDAKGPAHD
jgi:imidazolonepropionase-like amidohydrolase